MGIAPLYVTALFEPMAEQILLFKILIRSCDNTLRPDESIGQPVETALNHPSKNAGPFDPKLGLQLLIGFFRLWRERNDIETAAESLIYILQGRLIVAYDSEFELRWKREEILSHEASRYFIASGHLFNAGFRERLSFLGFRRRNEPRTAKHCKISRVFAVTRRCESVHCGGYSIVR